MKVYQSTLSVGTSGKVLIDATNRINAEGSSHSKPRKRKSPDIENLKPSKLVRKDGIYIDPPASVSIEKRYIDKAIQTNSVKVTSIEDEIKKVDEMLTGEQASPEYWKALAENRRKALQVSLDENRTLSEENRILKEENALLENMLEEAKQLAEIVNNLPELQENKKMPI